MRALDPFFFQGGDPSTDTFMYFSFLDSPSNNPREGKASETYECQILVSWPFRSGFHGEDEPLEVPEKNEERVAVMKSLAEGWAEPFRECVLSIPVEGTTVTTIRLEDFVPREGMWDNMGGRVTLVGDAAHAMTMCMLFLLPSALLVMQHAAADIYVDHTDRPNSQRRRRKSWHH